MQKRIHMLCTLALLIGLLGIVPSAAPARAQDTPSSTLTLLQPVPGAISDSQPEQRWTFEAKKGQRLSVRMQATSGNLDPLVELMDASGNVLASGSNGSLR